MIFYTMNGETALNIHETKELILFINIIIYFIFSNMFIYLFNYYYYKN